MGVNIDSFLEEFIKEQPKEENNKNKPKEQEKVNLDFEKNVQENLNKLSSTSTTSKDLNQLEQIYNEIKSFDQSLPQKFLSVEEIGNSSLEAIGKTYTQEYLQQLNSLTTQVKQKVDSNIELISQNLFDKNFTQIPLLLKQLRQLIKSIPKDNEIFLLEIKSKIKEKEIEIFKTIEEFKQKDLQSIKAHLNNEIHSLITNLKPGNAGFIKEQISNIEHIFESIPALFRVTLTNEHLVVNRAILKAQNYLKEELKKEAQRKITGIKHLEEEFNTAIINKDLNKALVYYNQIIYEFSQTPNHPVENKMTLLDDISNLHKKLTKLYINNNVNLFLETYNYSKIIEEAKDYINQAKFTGIMKQENINLLEKKLLELPTKFSQEKQELLNELKTLNNSNNQNEQREQKSSPNSNNSPVQEKILHEIDDLYGQFKKAQTKREAQTSYKKIDFYLNLAQLPESKIHEIKNKLAQEWSKKQ